MLRLSVFHWEYHMESMPGAYLCYEIHDQAGMALLYMLNLFVWLHYRINQLPTHALVKDLQLRGHVRR